METDTTGQWQETLKGITPDQLQSGVEFLRLSGRKWPPTAPEFRSICLATHEAKKLPSESTAFAELVKFSTDGRKDIRNLNRAIFHTLNNYMSYHEWNQLGTEKRMNIFRFAYRATVEHVERGGALDIPPAEPLRLEITPKTPEELRAAIWGAEIARLQLERMFADELSRK